MSDKKPDDDANPKQEGPESDSAESDGTESGDAAAEDAAAEEEEAADLPKARPAMSTAEAISQAHVQIEGLAKVTRRDERRLAVARDAQDAVRAHIASLESKIDAARAIQVGVAREAYMVGIDPGILNAVSTLETSGPSDFGQANRNLEMLGALHARQMQAAAELLVGVEAERAVADAAVAEAESALEVSRAAERAARDMLAIAQGGAAGEARSFESYPVSKCSFKDIPPNPSTCEQAQQWALNEVVSPSQNWYRSCLNFVTAAYGQVGGAPSAIAHWNSLPDSQRHAPTTVAPPGALMFWGPNHVALSMGNNVLISTDVLGDGRAWIVTFAEMQTVWKLEYLGWAPPDFSHS